MTRRRCLRYRKRLAEGVEAGGVGDLALRRHLKGCPACRQEFAQHRAIGRALRRLGPSDVGVSATKTKKGKVDRRRAPLAVGSVSAIGLVAALALNARKRSG